MKQTTVFPSILILGSTGSVGEQAIDVAKQHGIRVMALSAHRNWQRVAEQARELQVSAAAMTDREAAACLRLALADTAVRVYSGEDGLLAMIRETPAAFAVNAILGQAGLRPTLTVLESDKHLALANKESLVVAGEIVMGLARERGLSVTPVDSEHSAIFQALRAGQKGEIKRLILTASGGPFFGKKRTELANTTLDDALAHPTWQMGAKITVDSATLMNKGFEVIEAAHLFGVSQDKIDVVVHRESIIHSMVEYIDNSIIAQMSVPDMRLCVQYALTAPQRTEAVIPPLDLLKVGQLTFAAPDEQTFPLLALAKRALTLGGAVPAVLNAANEVAVAAFLARKIPFLAVSDTVVRVVEDMTHVQHCHTLSEILQSDREARERAAAYIALHS
ncbi:MAG: 1-deoxy-D-xylulose-5-phosphate reductoisomerase [Ruminococcaceae bacterium]|nr:1-deoxy-D-xylulose-5-phosphate reductoisomerase [Oscillospiraceae bacterium]